MKTLLYTITYVAMAGLLFVTNSFAASDYLLELDGVKGESKGKKIKLVEQTDGSFTAEDIPAGTYEIVYKAKQGKTGATKRGDGSVVLAFEGSISPRDAASGLPTGKRSSVKSPRDAASGQATGKRTHKPFSIQKVWDATTPQLVLGIIVVGDLDSDGDGLGDETRAQGDPVHGVDVKLGAKKNGPSATSYDIKIATKI